MARVLRFDAGTLQKPRRTSQGYLRVDGWASRTGALEYRNPDGSKRIEIREDDAVFAEDSLLGFEGAPITDDHPSEMVSIHNAKNLTKGTVLSTGRRDGDHVAVSLLITDPTLIAKMESGKRQLSTGYYVELDETPGVHPKYGRYDARQVRVGPVNHLAVVDRGRAGTASVRMDSADAPGLVEVTDELAQRLDAVALRITQARRLRSDSALNLHVANPVPNSESVAMTLEDALKRIKELETKLDALEAAPVEEEAPAGKKCPSCGTMNAADATACADCSASLEAKTDAAEVARIEGERDAARTDAETAKAEKAAADEAHRAELAKVRKDADETVSKKVREALDVLSKAVMVLGKDAKIKFDGKDVELIDAPLRAVKCAVIKHLKNKTIAAEKLDAYVDALFDDAVESFNPGTKSLAAAKAVVEDNGRKDAADPVTPAKDPEAAALEANKNRLSSAWMRKDDEENK